MTPGLKKGGSLLHRRNQTVDCRAFSLVEVVVATGLCTFALLVIGGLMPIGMGAFQAAHSQTIETEIYNEMWSEFNTTPFTNFAPSSTAPAVVNSALPDPFWFDADGGQLTSKTNATYFVRCSVGTSAATVPPIDGGFPASGTSSAYLNLAKIQIGYHVDPNTTTATDSRVNTRTFLLVKRD